MTLLQEPEISGDLDELAPEALLGQIGGIDPEIRHEGSEIRSEPEKDTMLKYCVVVSLALHLLLFAYVTRVAELTPTKALLNPGEKVTAVRLVETPPLSKPDEPPPEYASAMSDVNHRAEKERLPKMVPGPRSPLGKPEPVDKRIAALPPPMAPEDFIKPKEKDKKKAKDSKDSVEQPPPDKSGIKQKQRADPRSKKDSRQKRVDLSPTPGEVQTGISDLQGAPDFFPDGDVDEAVVDLNTREEKFFSYLLHLKRKIQAVWVYPKSAARVGLGGTLTVEFSVARDGELLYVNVVGSSGHGILDDAAIQAIKTAAPYYPFPERMRAKRLRIKANFIYVTGNFFRSIM